MKNMNIPIYRAKKINSDEYVEGFLFDGNKITSISRRYIDSMDRKFILPVFDEVDVLTLSIHFSDMTDSQENKIFASLNASGKGGDIIENYNFNNDYKNQIAIYDNCTLCLVDKDGNTYYLNNIEYDKIKVIGIQK